MTEFLDLPWQILVAIGGGHLGYRLAYIGQRFGHTQSDIVFLSLAFALLPALAIALLARFDAVVVGSVAVAAGLVGGLVWRWPARPAIAFILRYFNISWANDDVSALATLSNNSKWYVSAVAIQLDNGEWVECRDTSMFERSPFGAVTWGPSGDIALYATHVSDKDQITTLDAVEGDRITYIPASRVRKLTLRHKRD